MSTRQKTITCASALPQDVLHIKTGATGEGWGKKCHSYKSLPTRFRRDAFDYWQIHRQGDLAIYLQTWKGNYDSAAFEVIRIRPRRGFEIGGRFVPPAEAYPPSKLWGADGFTFTHKEAAFAKLRELT